MWSGLSSPIVSQSRSFAVAQALAGAGEPAAAPPRSARCTSWAATSTISAANASRSTAPGQRVRQRDAAGGAGEREQAEQQRVVAVGRCRSASWR